jgi:hypothetical protein
MAALLQAQFEFANRSSGLFLHLHVGVADQPEHAPGASMLATREQVVEKSTTMLSSEMTAAAPAAATPFAGQTS